MSVFLGSSASAVLFYIYPEYMSHAELHLIQPLAYRVWDPDRSSFYYTDVRPGASEIVDRWTGFFDRDRSPLYENDIIRVHHDWRLGWVRALVSKHPKREEYAARATAPDGAEIRIGFYCFAESYRVGNVRQHAGKLVRATEQFPAEANDPWWLSPAVFHSLPSASCN
jgi:hypothetical protein